VVERLADMLLICSQQIINFETKGHCHINSHSLFSDPGLFNVQVAAKNYPATGVHAEVYTLHAGGIYFNISVYFFSCLYYQNSVSGGLTISSYFYGNKTKGYVY
jgi:hypothetical protein